MKETRKVTSKQPTRPSKNVTEARAAAQRSKLEKQAEVRRNASKESSSQATPTKKTGGKKDQQRLLARRRAGTTLEGAVADYLLDHEGGNSSLKTLQWHQTALGQLRSF